MCNQGLRQDLQRPDQLALFRLRMHGKWVQEVPVRIC
jgi:hypothetical protein